MTSSLRLLNLVPILLIAFGLPCIQSRTLDFIRAYGDVCGYPLGSEIRDDSITASSNRAEHGAVLARYERLDYPGWRPAVSNRRQWWQVELQLTIYVTGILTQGNIDTDNYVMLYKVKYKELKHWMCLMDMHSHPKIFHGNTDHKTPHLNKFRPAVLAHSIRIVPVKWHNEIGMKIEIFGGGCAECWEK